jgi:hypothetical protein
MQANKEEQLTLKKTKTKTQDLSGSVNDTYAC